MCVSQSNCREPSRENPKSKQSYAALCEETETRSQGKMPESLKEKDNYPYMILWTVNVNVRNTCATIRSGGGVSICRSMSAHVCLGWHVDMQLCEVCHCVDCDRPLASVETQLAWKSEGREPHHRSSWTRLGLTVPKALESQAKPSSGSPGATNQVTLSEHVTRLHLARTQKPAAHACPHVNRHHGVGQDSLGVRVVEIHTELGLD